MGRKRKDIIRQIKPRSRKALYVIATEGEKTEPDYFNAFKRRNILIETLEAKKGNSSPNKVLEKLKTYKTRYHASPNELWLVIDRDHWKQETLEAIKRECDTKGFNFIMSNPCFELWLLLHQDNPPQPLTAQRCLQEITKLIPDYKKTDYDVVKLQDKVGVAIAKRLNYHNVITEAPSTTVFKLVEKLVSEDDDN